MRAVAAVLVLALAACATTDPRAARTREPADASASAAPAGRLLPESVDFVLPNGMRVFLVPDHEVPLVDLHARLAGGTVDDPEGREGTAALLAALLTKGAGARDAKAFREEVELVGGQVSASVASRWLTVSAQFLKGDADLAMELFSDVLLRPRLAEDEFAKEKGLALDGLRAAREEPRELLDRYFSSWMFGGHPFARPWSGDEASVGRVEHADVRAAAARQLAPGRAWLAVAGDFDPADMRRRVEAAFGAWTSDAPPAANVGAWSGTTGGTVLLVDKADALQTYFRFGNLAFDRSDPDYPARAAANSTLGGRFTSRLNKTLRTEKGFTYGAGSSFDDERQGLFAVSTQGTDVATTAECLPLADSIYRAFVAEGMTAEDLAATKAYLRGQFGPGFETGAQQAAAILDLEFDGLPRDLVDRFLERVSALTLDDVNRVIRERFPKRLDWVVIGPAQTCRDVVSRFGTVTECKVTDPGFGPPRPR